MITVDSVPKYLLELGIITHQTILDGDLDIMSINRRNKNLQIKTRDRGGFMVKQPSSPNDPSFATLQTEGKFYEYVHHTTGLEKVRAVFPSLVHLEPEEGRLILELIEDTQPLWRFYKEQTAGNFPSHISGRIGRLLGQLHQEFVENTESQPAFMKKDLPWALEIDRPSPDHLAKISAAHFEVIKHIQSESEVVAQLDRLRREWDSGVIIHGDVKMDNFLVQIKEESSHKEVFLIDWEMAQLGDPAWDLGGAFHDFIFWWVLSMPHDKGLDEMVCLAGNPLPSLLPGLKALWENYCEARKLKGKRRRIFLDRANRYSGARMLQTAAEIASKFQTMPMPSTLMLQIAVNLLKHPQVALEELYGGLQ